MQELLNFFKETIGSLKSRRSSAVSCQFFAKTVDNCCIFNNIDRLGLFAISIKLLGHPRVIFAYARSSLKF